MCEIICSVVNGEIQKSLEEEIRVTIREKLLKSKYKNDEIDKAIAAFFAGDDDNIPALIEKLALTVSYDMGWQKQSTGKLYDS